MRGTSQGGGAQVEFLALVPGSRILARPSEHSRFELNVAGESRGVLSEKEFRALLMLLRGATPREVQNLSGLSGVENFKSRLMKSGLLASFQRAWLPQPPSDFPRASGGRLRTELVAVSGNWILSYAD